MDPNNNNNQNNLNQWFNNQNNPNQWFNPNLNQYQNPNQYPQFQNPNQYQHPNQFQNFNQLPNPNQYPQFYQQTPPPQRPSQDPVYQGGSFQQLLNLSDFPLVPPFDVDRNRGLVDSEDDDVVPETQPEIMPTRGKRRHKKKETESQRGKTEKKRWTEREEVTLASAWSSTSEDPILGNDQHSPLYWTSVREKFFHKMRQDDPDYARTNDMISSKWTDLQRKVQKFNGIMRQAQQTRTSGQSDKQLLEHAMEIYRTKMQVGFQHYASWEILRRSPICQHVPTSGGSSKARKTSESSNPTTPATPVSPFAGIDLNDDDDDLQLEEEIPRPIGRDQAKAKARKGKGKAAASSSGAKESLQFIGKKFGEFTETAQEKLRAKALKTIMKDISHLGEPYRTIAEEEKKRLIEKKFPQHM